jgi:predicted O-methyltransferase YrrM
MADLLDNVRAARRQLHEAGPRAVRADGDFERVAIPNADADVLRDLLVGERAATVLEIGLAYGSSALAIAEALLLNRAAKARHVIVDAYQDHFHEAGWNAIVAAGLETICTLVRQRSQLALPRLIDEGLVVDAAFVDGSHLFHNVFVDLCFARELVRPGGLIVLDDGTLPSVATAVRYFELNMKWGPQPIDHPTRLRAFRLPNPLFEPSFEDFTAFGDEPHAR